MNKTSLLRMKKNFKCKYIKIYFKELVNIDFASNRLKQRRTVYVLFQHIKNC